MNQRLTQRDRILGLLRENKGMRVPSSALGRISLQYGARVKELRDLGYQIRNDIERVSGQVHGYFTLESEPCVTATEPMAMTQPAPGLFPTSERNSSMLEHELGRRGGR